MLNGAMRLRRLIRKCSKCGDDGKHQRHGARLQALSGAKVRPNGSEVIEGEADTCCKAKRWNRHADSETEHARNLEPTKNREGPIGNPHALE